MARFRQPGSAAMAFMNTLVPTEARFSARARSARRPCRATAMPRQAKTSAAASGMAASRAAMAGRWRAVSAIRYWAVKLTAAAAALRSHRPDRSGTGGRGSCRRCRRGLILPDGQWDNGSHARQEAPEGQHTVTVRQNSVWICEDVMLRPAGIVRCALLERGQTPDKLAEAMQVDAKTVERWITNGRMPYRRHRLEVATFLGVDESYI